MPVNMKLCSQFDNESPKTNAGINFNCSKIYSGLSKVCAQAKTSPFFRVTELN
jgi:hypothetical protein